jgi:nucleoside-diphosphate-sugar epimerase
LWPYQILERSIEPMKIAVTGATGFVGKHILNELVNQKNIEIVATTRQEVRMAPEKDGINWVSININQPPKNVFEVLGRPDVLIHLAWNGLSNYRSLDHFEIELPAQYRFLKTLVEQGLQSLVVTGTCFEYGMQSGPLSPSIKTAPENPYGFAKDILRKQLEYLQSEYTYNLTWARLFYIYGEGQSDNSLLPQLRKAVELGKKQFNMSGGEQLRDYLPVTEVARQLVKQSLDRKKYGILNICSGKPQSVRSLVESWIRENNWQISPSFGHYPYPDYEPMAFWGDKK